MIAPTDRLSIGTLFRRFPARIAVTWGLTFLETAMFALLPLMIGWSIDGLLAGEGTAFTQLLVMLAALLAVATGRRVFDTRAYGTMRAAIGQSLVARAEGRPVSVVNARALMARELVDFLEEQAPLSITALIQVIVSVAILMSFHGVLALAAGGAALGVILIYALFARMFFRLNGALNAQTEGQIAAITSRDMTKIAGHFMGIRGREVRLSDAESVVYGLIFLMLLSMLAFNLWFAAAQSGASAGQIFAIVTYSYEFVQAAVTLPIALQALTRLSEITERINRPIAGSETDG